MAEERWHDLGSLDELRDPPLRQVVIGRNRIALSYRDGVFGAISGACNHVAGPLGEGTLEGDYVVCPWHYWKFHRVEGVGEPGYEADVVPRYALEERDGHLFVDLGSASQRRKAPHAAHPLTRSLEREPGELRVVGISTTAMNLKHPRYSTSDALLETALEHARSALGCETRLLRLRELRVRPCEGYYSKAAHACTWPCSITQMDRSDEMEKVYEAIVFWGDVVLVSTPIRWGAPSALYTQMVERMNCVQNQMTIRDRVLLRNKVASFLITGGQDNIQAVAGQMLTFFSEIGCHFPQFPFIAHSRGWSAEDMENNVAEVQGSEELRRGARDLVERAVRLAGVLLAADGGAPICRGGRKAGTG